MTIEPERLLAWTLDASHTYTARDTKLYALGLGLGADPMDPMQLRFVNDTALQALPTLPVVLGYTSGWLSGARQEIDAPKVVHGEQGLVIHRLPDPAGQVKSHLSVDEVVDKGPGRGALIYTRREIADAISEDPIATSYSTTFCRGDGGFGGAEGRERPVTIVPERKPDASMEWSTIPQQALIYRLSGDYHLLHSDPDYARAAGFPRPILHGLCTYGIAGWLIIAMECGGDPSRLRELWARFSAPVFPGETIRLDLYREDNRIIFEASVPSRQAKVLSQGHAVVS
jgi:acyl dehydratase